MVSGASSRRLGKSTELMVVKWLKANGWPDARRQLAGQGQTSDIDGVPGISIEVKCRAASAWPTWCRQAATQAASHHHRVVVVRRELRNVNVGTWEARWCHPPNAGWHVGTFAEALS